MAFAPYLHCNDVDALRVKSVVRRVANAIFLALNKPSIHTIMVQPEKEISLAFKKNMDPEDIESMRDAVQTLLTFCLSDDEILPCLDTDTCFHASNVIKILNDSVRI